MIFPLYIVSIRNIVLVISLCILELRGNKPGHEYIPLSCIITGGPAPIFRSTFEQFKCCSAPRNRIVSEIC
jgi:hypothetical protein